MRASVIIPHYNDAARLITCLDALLPQAEGRDDVDILVVDNASTDPLDDMRAKFPGLRILTEPKPGAAEARNTGVKQSLTYGILFLDADCVPAPDWLDAAMAALGKGDIVGGDIATFDETPAPRSGAEAFEAVFAFQQQKYIEQDGFAVTANLVTTRPVFDAVGPFIHGVSEDLDWCHRARAKGFSLAFDPGLKVSHPTRQDWPALRKKWLRLTREMFAIARAERGRLYWALRGLAVIASALPHGRHVLQSPRLNGAKERFGALATLWRLRTLRGRWMLRQAMGGTIM